MINLAELITLATTHNLRLIPLLPKNKIPAIKDWTNKASYEAEVIKEWYVSNPEYNWGIATGSKSNIFVVDIDPKNGGDETWEEIIKAQGEPATVTVKTGSGGSHYYFLYPVNFVVGNSSGKFGKGIDIRGEGGQVVIPPSFHPNGNQYEWINDPETTAIATAPQWLLDGIKGIKRDEEFTPLGGELEKGNRNSSIYHQSLILARSGGTAEIIFPAIRVWCNVSGNDDISDTEIQDTVQSAIKKVKEDADKKDKVSFGKTDDDNAKRLYADWSKDLVYVTGMG